MCSRDVSTVGINVLLKHNVKINIGGIHIVGIARHCKQCKKMLVRKEYETPSTFTDRLFCNRNCSNIWQRGNGHPWRSAIVTKRK
jgi:hypothetical protein